MSKRLVTSALAQFTAKTAGRNMTKAAYAAVAAGVAAMVVLTTAPAYEVAHHWVDAVLWTCLVYFVFEWLVRLRHMAGQGRLSLYALSGSGVVDAIGALAVPVALLAGIEPDLVGAGEALRHDARALVVDHRDVAVGGAGVLGVLRHRGSHFLHRGAGLLHAGCLRG